MCRSSNRRGATVCLLEVFESVPPSYVYSIIACRGLDLWRTSSLSHLARAALQLLVQENEPIGTEDLD